MSQQGSTRKRGSTWTAYWWVAGEDGRKVQKSKGGFKLKSDAQAHLTTVLGAIQEGTYTEPTKLTVAQFMRDHWLPSLEKRASTKASYVSTVEKWIIPHLGGVPLAQLRPIHVSEMVVKLRTSGRKNGKGLGDRSVQYAVIVLKMATKFAAHNGLIARDTLAGMDRPLVRRKEMSAWTAEEAGRFLDGVEQDRLYAAWLLFLTRGPRRGEVAGLRWADLDLDKGRLSIIHTRVVVDGKAESSEPKTDKSRRTIPLDAELVAAFRAHRKAQLEERLAWGEGWKDTGYVFTYEDGTPLHPEHLSTAFECHVKRLKLRSIRLHDTRHTAATLALQAGIQTEVVSRWLGHSSVSITQEIYQHVIPSMLEEAGEKLTGIIRATRRQV